MTQPREANEGGASGADGFPFGDRGRHFSEEREAVRWVGVSLIVLGAALIGLIAVALATGGGAKRGAPTPGAGQASTGAVAPGAPGERAGEGGATADASPASGDETPAAGTSGAREAASAGTALESARETLASDADEARKRFEAALVSAGEGWARGSREESERMVAAVAAFAHADATRAQAPSGWLDSLARPALRLAPDASARLTASDVSRAAFSAGALARLHSERDLPAAWRQAIGAHLRRIGLGLERPEAGVETGAAAFWRGAVAALRRAPALIVSGAGGASDAGGEQVWRAWLECVGAAGVALPAERDPLLLHGAHALLAAASAGPPDASARAMARVILGEASFMGPAARRGFLAILDDERVSARELAPVTQWLAGAGQSGLGVDHVVHAGATAAERAATRARIGAAWNIASAAETDALRTRWLAEARRAASASVSSGAVGDELARAATLAAYCRAGAEIARGDHGSARATMDRIVSEIQSAGSATGGARGPSPLAHDPSRDGAWALRFLSARRSAVERRRAMAELNATTSPLGPVDAEVLLEAAIAGSPADVRAQALRIAERRAGEPTMLNALLEQAPRAPRNDAIGALYSLASGATLPPVRDRRWPMEARRAIVSKLLNSLSGSSDLSAIDRYASLLAGAHGAWAAPAGTSARAGGSPPSAAGATAGVRAALRSEIAQRAGEPGGDRTLMSALASCDRRHAARSRLAQGPMQAFHAEQVAIADLLAVLARAEGPDAEREAAQALADLGAARRQARDVFAQIDAAQTTMLRLMLVREAARKPDGTAPTPPAPGASAAPAVASPTPDAPEDSAASAHTIADGTNGPLTDESLAQRLSALTPSDPWAYFELAEEVAERGANGDAALARRLFALSYSLAKAEGTLRASACIALAWLADGEQDRARLLALAEALRAEGLTLLAPESEIQASADDLDRRFAAATALGLFRSGEFARAAPMLERAEVRALLDRRAPLLGSVDAMIRDARSKPSCRECRNARVVRSENASADGPPPMRLCYTCNGNPGPVLDTQQYLNHLRAEASLLGGAAQAWTTQFLADAGEALRELTPEELPAMFNVDVTASVYRDGAWVNPGK